MAEVSSSLPTHCQTNLKKIHAWAKHAAGVLCKNTAEDLQGSAMKTVFRKSIGLPLLSTFMGNEVVSTKLEAQTELLRFNLDLRRYLNCEINEQEYQQSKQSAIDALSIVIKVTS
jgi:hypothetical protein